MLHRTKLVGFALMLALPSIVDAQDPSQRMRNYLRTRVESHPQHAGSWRMWGVFELQQGNLEPAHQALTQAVALDSQNAAAHYSLGQCLMRLGQTDAARSHLYATVELAPGSAYAEEAAAMLPPDTPNEPAAIQVGYEVQRLDGSDTTSAIAQSVEAEFNRDDDLDFNPAPLSVQLEFGALYNSNITLSPTRRDFGAPQQASAQGFVSSAIEYRLVNNAYWGIGPSFSGFFSVNENDALADLNLQSYQPGLFLERTICRPSTILVPRVQYDYTLDQFDGVTFGTRHAVTSSITSLWDRGDTSVLYWTSNHTNFEDDGATPASTSRDGWTHSLGLSHTLPLDWRIFEDLTFGGDVQWADVIGEDFAYFGGALFVGVTIPLAPTLLGEIEGSWGMRDYYESAITPSRNETIWRASAKITKSFGVHWTLSGVFNLDRFNSDNALFEADRQVAGLVVGFRR